ncbi:MAG: tyrosine-type recombinase/integrase [Xanthobacteraceae bacterium]
MSRLTKRVVDAAKPDAQRDVFLWDGELRGFGLRVKPNGKRSFFIQYRNRNGRSRRFTVGQYGHLTADEARRKAQKLLATIIDGQDPAAQRAADRAAMTVAELCDEYFDKAKRGLIITRRRKVKKASTLYTDCGRIERHIKPLIGRRTVKDLTSRDVSDFLRDVIAGKSAADVKTKSRGRAIVKGGRGAATRTLGLLGGILTYAVDAGYRSDNPVTRVVRPADGRRKVHLTIDEYQLLGAALNAAEHNGACWQAVAAIRLIALTGCRRGEIEKLRWSEVDEAGHCLRFRDNKTGQSGSVRPIGGSAIEVLRSIRRQGELGQYVLPSLRQQDAPYAGLAKAWKRIIVDPRLAELPPQGWALTPHGLRHAFGSTLEELGYTVPTIGSLLGHAGNGVTMGYIHKTDSALIVAADRVSQYIWSAMADETNIVGFKPPILREELSGAA